MNRNAVTVHSGARTTIVDPGVVMGLTGARLRELLREPLKIPANSILFLNGVEATGTTVIDPETSTAEFKIPFPDLG